MVRPELCHTKATIRVCIIQKTTCRHTLYFGENKRSLVLGTSILPAFFYKVRIKYAMCALQDRNKTNGIFLRQTTDKSTSINLRGNRRFISANFYAKRFSGIGVEQLATFSLQCKEMVINDIFSIQIHCFELLTIKLKS